MHRYNFLKRVCAVALLCASCVHVGARSSTVTLRVVDESGAAITGAAVRLFFSVDEGPGPAPNSRQHDGVTGSGGLYRASDRCDGGVGFDVNMRGYYESRAVGIPVHEQDGRGGWRRINPSVDVILSKVGDPIPMYARHIDWEIKIPTRDREFGFDLLLSDWVRPNGKGEHSDLNIKLSRVDSLTNDAFESVLSVTFPHLGDGLVAASKVKAHRVMSVMTSPRTAPDLGYEQRIERHKWRHSGGTIETDCDPDQHYCFRIRSVVQGDRVVSGLYGKLRGDVQFDVVDTDTAFLSFTYYVNPTPNSRNVEFDPAQNMFKNLNWRNEVRDP